MAWTNSALGMSLAHRVNHLLKSSQVFLYTAGIISLAFLTQFSCDQQIWARDIDSSPCPFPFPALLVYVFPFAVKHLRGTSVEPREPDTATYCLPGCSCHAKPNEVPALAAESANYIEGIRSSIPIRVPTVMDRQNAIHVTLGYLA